MSALYLLGASVLLRAGAWCARRVDVLGLEDVLSVVFGPPTRRR